MRTIILVAIIAATIWFLRGREPDNWLATVYPSASDLTEWTHLGRYDSLEACRDAANLHLSRIGSLSTGTYEYECGLNCESFAERYGLSTPDAYEMNICEETRE